MSSARYAILRPSFSATLAIFSQKLSGLKLAAYCNVDVGVGVVLIFTSYSLEVMPCVSFSEDLARILVLANPLNPLRSLVFAGAKIVSFSHTRKYFFNYEVGEFYCDLK